MKEKIKKNTRIIILVVCIMLTIIGVAYSFIAPLISGVETESTISFHSGMIKIAYQGSNVITGENIIPGWSEVKEFTVVGSNNTSVTQEDIMDYAIKLVVEENTFSDGAIRFELTGSSSNDADTLSPLFGKVPTGTGETLLGTARFNQDDNIKSDVTHSYSLKIGFPNDPSKNQSNDWDKTFSGYVVVEEGTLEKQEPLIISEYITKQYTDSFDGINYLQEDDFGNIRYVGATPKNYIIFNDETWRIIGVVDDGVKIIRQDHIINADDESEMFYWNTENIIFWGKSTLQKYLNETYYESLTKTSQNLIQEFDWKLGNTNGENNLSTKEMYVCERTIDDEYEYAEYQKWTGNIALMYPSDWGYANINSSCRNTFSYTKWDSVLKESILDDCFYYNWISNDGIGSSGIWLLTVPGGGYLSAYVLYPERLGTSYFLNRSKYRVNPTLYLKSNTIITGGTGTSDNPYTISLN